LVVLFASPLINHVEDDFAPLGEINDEDSKHRWEMIPDIEGNMRLVDMSAYNMSMLPLFDAEKDMRFVLTTRIASTEELKFDTASIEASSFNKNHPTRITIHGWNGDLTSIVNTLVTEEYLKYGNFNCITVDWSRGAGQLKLKLIIKAELH
jgi:predicted alpha/beta-fold hydrolase